MKRYLYHLTTEENYKKMLQDGKINVTSDCLLNQDGVFMMELDNFTKHWGTAKEWDKVISNPDGFYLSLALLSQTSKGTGRVVCLRIPTAKLDHDLLKIRSQNKLALGGANDHLRTGAPAREARLYGNRKEAVEYIYSEDIPMDRVEYIGSATAPGALDDWEKMKIWTKSEQRNMVLDTFRELFRGRPEAKAFENLA